MKRIERFSSLAEVDTEKARLDARRKVHQARWERHWHALQDHEVRGHLIRDAANDAFRSWKPARMLAGLLGDGSFGSAFGAAARTSGGLPKRALWFGASLLLPGLLKRAAGISLETLQDEFRISFDRIKDYVSSRIAKHRNHDGHADQPGSSSDPS